MAVFVSGFINDLYAVKDNIRLRVRVLRTWTQVMYNKPHVKNLEMILMDENDTKMQATVRMANVNQFAHKLVEGSAVMLERYSLGEIQPRFRMVNNALRLSFLSNTTVEPCPDFTWSMYGFVFRSYKSITDCQIEEDGQFDVIGHVTACEELDNYDKNGNKGKKKPLTLIDHDEVIEKDEFKDVEQYRLRLFARQHAEPSENTASKISAGSKFSTKDDFLNKYPVKNIVELLDVEKNTASVIVGTIIAIQEEEGWWYLGCRKCSKKVVKESEFVDLDADVKSQSANGADQWRCTKCNEIVKGIGSIFRLQVRVQDESGTMLLSLFNDEVQSLTGRSAYQLCEKYGLKNADQQMFPSEITGLVGKRLAFKVSIDEYNLKKMLPVFTVLRLSDDVDILNALTASATPIKDNEATSSKAVGISALDLESQTDENVTPTNLLKSTATSPPAKSSSSKRPSDVEPSTQKVVPANTDRKGTIVEALKDNGVDKKDSDVKRNYVAVDVVNKKETKPVKGIDGVNASMEYNDSKRKPFEDGNSTYYDSDDSIDSWILKSIQEESCGCPVCSGTCKCPPGKCECSYCSPPTP
ncbi:replication protein A 70 kDa DNA-binding subunit B [Artemisia annua]|uniref:Replication protein A 70 kDa DNA-binding subunit B n=1 Tax=Artemisia annua TaxID=35608 RepID=A0A2U1L4K4_ARTAN|nr:replication protein A 70 kDa DNA-binding subunit B [Artemisia annua]